MPIQVDRALWRRLTGERPPPRICDGCGCAKSACRCLELALAKQIIDAGLPTPWSQYRAVLGRKFRWDLAWLDHRLLVEIQGGTHLGAKGGHTSAVGMNRDAEKLNLATLAGWRCLVVTGEQVKSGDALRWIKAALTEAE